MKRPLGLDPEATEEIEIDGVGSIRAGFIPWGKWDAINAEVRRARHESALRMKGVEPPGSSAEELEAEIRAVNPKLSTDDVAARVKHIREAALHQMDPPLAEKTAECNREFVRWGVRGWTIEGLPEPQTERVDYQNRKYTVLTQASLDMLECARLLPMFALRVWLYWTLTEAEKKSSMTPTSAAGTADSASETQPSGSSTPVTAEKSPKVEVGA